MKFPCEECVCRPICKSKDYKKLVTECGVIESYLLATDIDDGKWHFPERINKLRELFNYD
jgi:hypothetical protein